MHERSGDARAAYLSAAFTAALAAHPYALDDPPWEAPCHRHAPPGRGSALLTGMVCHVDPAG